MRRLQPCHDRHACLPAPPASPDVVFIFHDAQIIPNFRTQETHRVAIPVDLAKPLDCLEPLKRSPKRRDKPPIVERREPSDCFGGRKTCVSCHTPTPHRSHRVPWGRPLIVRQRCALVFLVFWGRRLLSSCSFANGLRKPAFVCAHAE